jgi:hypothetical protein
LRDVASDAVLLGKILHVSTLYRWAKRGVGGVLLETWPVGNLLCTTDAAVDRFIEAIKQHRKRPMVHSQPAARGSEAKKARENAKTQKRLEARLAERGPVPHKRKASAAAGRRVAAKGA